MCHHLIVAGLVVATAAVESMAQTTAPPSGGRPSAMWLVGFDASGYHRTDGTGPMGLGFSIVAEQPVNTILGLRGSLSAMDTWDTADLRVCNWRPSGECRAVVVPARVWSLNASLVSRLYPRGLLFGMIGAGAALPNGAHEVGDASVDSSTTARLSGHAGLEVAFGRSVNMPRIRIVRTRYWGNMHSMKGYTLVSFMLRLL